jgi:DNA-binding transcriptional LysR family regulator
MNLRQVEIFCAVMRCRTIVAAAHELGVSQPAVSTALKHIEAQLGLCLFERVGNRLVPTQEARTLHRDAMPLHAMSQALAVKVRDLRHTRRGTLRVLATQAMARPIGARALSRFLASRPEVQVFFEVRRVEGIVEALESGFADLGMALSPAPRPGIRIEKLTGGRMVVVMPRGHRLVRRGALVPADMQGERMVGLEAAAPLGAMVRDALERAGVPYRPEIEVRHAATACMLVEQGLGIAVVDPFSAAPEYRWQIEVRPFHPEIALVATAMHLETARLSRMASQFLADLREVAAAGPGAEPIQAAAPGHGRPPRRP